MPKSLGASHCLAVLCLAVAGVTGAAPTLADAPGRLGLGAPASEAIIESMDIAIGPDGAELPAGRGTVAEGAVLYAERCAMCHGASGREGPDPVLVGGQGSLGGEHPVQTVGSYWPYATTLYDYVYRAMPFTAPGSLQPNEVYALVAWLLNANGIVGAEAVIDRLSLRAVRMPNRDGFVPDTRPDTGKRGTTQP